MLIWIGWLISLLSFDESKCFRCGATAVGLPLKTRVYERFTSMNYISGQRHVMTEGTGCRGVAIGTAVMLLVFLALFWALPVLLS